MNNIIQHNEEWLNLYNEVNSIQKDITYINGSCYIEEPYNDYIYCDNMTIEELEEHKNNLKDIFIRGIQNYNIYFTYATNFSEFLNEEERLKREQKKIEFREKQRLKERRANRKLNDTNKLNLIFNHPIKELLWCQKK